MGGKGRRRREKNYRAAHGGSATTLPPPPDVSKLDAWPSKLRKLMPFTSSSLDADSSNASSHATSNRRDTGHSKSMRNPFSKDEPSQKLISDDGDLNEPMLSSEPVMEIVEDATDKKKKRKRKRGQVVDLRSQSSVDESSRRKERRKKRQKEYRDAKKNKHKKANNEEALDFPRHEKVKFGEVVEGPPKLVAVPKGLKTHQDVSKERIRLQAVEAYRNRKGWASRPGSLLPPVVDTLLQS